MEIRHITNKKIRLKDNKNLRKLDKLRQYPTFPRVSAVFSIGHYGVLIKKHMLMLGYFFIKQRFVNYVKSNLYLDFGLKKLSGVFVHNVLIQTAYFFAEKFIIEYSTRFFFNYSASLFNSVALKLNYNYFFFYAIVFMLNVGVLVL